jgi:hypothetical protein
MNLYSVAALQRQDGPTWAGQKPREGQMARRTTVLVQLDIPALPIPAPPGVNLRQTTPAALLVEHSDGLFSC